MTITAMMQETVLATNTTLIAMRRTANSAPRALTRARHFISGQISLWPARGQQARQRVRESRGTEDEMNPSG